MRKNKHSTLFPCPGCLNSEPKQIKIEIMAWEHFQNTTTFTNECKKCGRVWVEKRTVK